MSSSAILEFSVDTFSYILNRGWVDKSERRLPTYREITSVRPDDEPVLGDDQDADAEDVVYDEEFEEIEELFETSYNFRFEEPCVICINMTNHVLILRVQRCS